jgi:hypothetical protein
MCFYSMGTEATLHALDDAFFLTESGRFEYGLTYYSKRLVARGKRFSSGVTVEVVATDMLAELFCEYYYFYGYFRRSVQR